jgi:prepilin-type N-terminal cleavage/methylation domain-containing protein
MISAHRLPLRRRAQAGFSLIELGIVIAVIAVLAGVVIFGKGYLDAAKKKAAVDLVLAIRSAGQQYAMRNYNGIAFGKSEADAPGNISLGRLQFDSFLPNPTTTPWAPTIDGRITISPDGGTFCGQYGGRACDRCVGYACMRIEFETPSNELCVELATDSFSKFAVACSCAGTKLRISTR